MMPILRSFFLVLLGQVILTAAQLESPGKCPTIKVIKNFDSKKYLGRWYEYSNYDNKFSQQGTCDIAQYTDATEAGKPLKIAVLNRAVRDGVDKFDYQAKGNADLGEPNNPDKPGKLIVNFYDPPSRVISETTNYNILDTDYTSFTTVYLCRQKDAATKSEFLWILTRKQFPPKALVDKATAIIQGNGIDTSRLKKTVQTNCPDADASSAIQSNPSLVSMAMALMCLLLARFQL